MDHRQEFARFLERVEREAYERGWRDAVAAISAAASRLGSPTTIPSYTTAAPKAKQARRGTGINTVRETITTKPGLTGVEIVNEVAAAGVEVSERTVRTSLHRLKRDGVIEQRNSRWYPREPTLEEMMK